MARDDEQHGEDAAAPWHNSTAKLLGASVAAVAAIGLIVGSVVFVTRQAEEPTQAPLNFVDPSFSNSRTTSASTTSAPATTTGGRPLNPQTTDIDLPPPSDTTPSSSEPSTSRRLPTTREEESEDDGEGPTTTRNRPRFNETRTLYPRP